jgi:hypothetical protein
MKKNISLIGCTAFGLLSVMVALPVHPLAQAQVNKPRDFVPPIVFQAAGPTIASIQSSVDEYRDRLGNNNGITPPGGPIIAGGRREINWDGGNAANTTTSLTPTPVLDQFLEGRGARFTTPGSGFVQAPPAGLAAADVFNNPSYATIFKAFSLSRLFSAIGSNITEVDFFVPGGGETKATVAGFGAVFTDVDQPDGGGPGKKHTASTQIEYFNANGAQLFSSVVPASPGDGSLSFFGIVFEDKRIAHVRITSGNVAPGPDDGGKPEVVMMDDFIYSEPQALP